MKHVRIVLAEEETASAMATENTLKKLGYRVVGIADSADKAVAVINVEKPDLVLMDICIQGAIDGITAADAKLPPRMTGIPPKEEGPVKGVTIDIDSLAQEYHKAMGWDPETGSPTDATINKLGLKALVDQHG